MKTLTIALLFSLLFLACQKDDNPCFGVLCDNGGTCINGACDCPPEWGGPDCSTPAKPSSIRISKIYITKWPTTKPDGTGWDTNNTPPDIYFILSNDTKDLIKSDTYYDIAPTELIIWSGTNIDPDDNLTIRLFDEDLITVDEYMGGYQFPAWRKELGHPAERILKVDGSDIEVVLELLYYF